MLVQVVDGLGELLRVVDVAQDLLPTAVDLLERRRHTLECIIEDQHLQLPWCCLFQRFGHEKLGEPHRVTIHQGILDPYAAPPDEAQDVIAERNRVGYLTLHCRSNRG